MAFHTIRWSDAGVVMIDQRKLPAQETYVTARNFKEVAEAIEQMVIRGAPAIGIAAAMGAALGAKSIHARTRHQFDVALAGICDRLAKTRPTAVNLFWALDRMRRKAASMPEGSLDEIKEALVREALLIHEEDIEANKRLGRHGASLIPSGAAVLTHCNAGALATGGYGTALGVVRAAVEMGKSIRVIASETRPFLQGARLTAWELARDEIDVTLITDSMV
ncbi:MAG: s-methyl-5-thioribose-1-phosphate isomerase, partial [Vicinamibacteria bacterium]